MLELQLQERSVRCRAAEAQRLVQQILRSERRRMDLTVTVVDDAASRRWNRRCLGHDWSTDVVAQAYGANEGEVVVNACRASREARKRGHPAAAELLFYIAHGLLHLLGYDDATPKAREKMLALQSRHLARLGHVVH